MNTRRDAKARISSVEKPMRFAKFQINKMNNLILTPKPFFTPRLCDSASSAFDPCLEKRGLTFYFDNV